MNLIENLIKEDYPLFSISPDGFKTYKPKGDNHLIESIEIKNNILKTNDRNGNTLIYEIKDNELKLTHAETVSEETKIFFDSMIDNLDD